MHQLIRRLEGIYSALRAASENFGDDPRIDAAVADCLREWRGIAAQAANRAPDAPARLRLIDCEAPAQRSLLQ